MAEDYDKRRRPKGSVEEVETDSLEELQLSSHKQQTATIDVDEEFALPDTNIEDIAQSLSEEEFTVPVIPMQQTEFRCSSCFLVHPIRRRAYNRNSQPVCNDCA